jgi:DUF1009 family protein
LSSAQHASLVSSGLNCVGLVAGSGILPLLCARALRARVRPDGTEVRIVAIAHRGETDPALADWVDDLTWVHLGQFGRILSFLRQQQTTDVVLLGGITKARIWRIRPDAVALRLVARLPHLQDDMLLRAVAGELERHGLRVRGVGELLPELLVPRGVLTRTVPTRAQWEDIAIGWHTAKQLGALDVGQGVVVRERVVVAVEAIEGTDAMLARAGGLTRGGGVLVKVAKPMQDDRLDLPTVGPQTIVVASRAGVRVMALEAGRTLMVDPAQTIADAEQHGVVLVGCGESSMEKRVEQ